MAMEEKRCFFCYKSSSDITLYNCQYPGCLHLNRAFCLPCGRQSHSNKSVFKHEFAANQPHIKSVQAVERKIAKTIGTIRVQDTTTPNTNYAVQRSVNYGGIAVHQLILILDKSKALLIKNGVKDYGFKEIMKQAQNLKYAKHGLKEVGKKTVGNVKHTQYALEQFGKSTAVVQVLFYAWEIGGHLKRYNDNIISKKELQRLCLKSTAGHAGAWAGGMAGAAYGGAVGGAPGLVIGGLIGGVVGDFGTRYLFDKFIYDEEQKEQEKDMTEALRFFQYLGDIGDVWDDPDFDEQTIKKRYHERALEAHPDRPKGSPEKWDRALNYYNIMLGLLKAKESRNKNKNAQKKNN